MQLKLPTPLVSESSSFCPPEQRGSVSAYWRIGVWGSKTAFRHGCKDQEVSTKLTTLANADTPTQPIRRNVSPSRPILIATIYLLFRGQDTRAFASALRRYYSRRRRYYL